ncbi:MAG: hypothetical protein AAF357_02965 [Verrucomicrobiota bacterium]
MSQIKLYIGLDVHKNPIAVALAPAGNFTPIFYGTMGGSNLSVERGLNRLLQKFDLLTYEAGSTGFVLARHRIKLRCCGSMRAQSERNQSISHSTTASVK